MAFNWNIAFIETAVRAIRKLHAEYGMWGLGQGTIKPIDFSKLNQGPGIELALETAVCAAITQEFINSPLTNGLLINKEVRRYEIEREVQFTSNVEGDKNKAIDIFINRFKIELDGSIKYFRFPVLIEAKRAHYFTPNVASGERGKKVEKFENVQSDIDKLLNLRDNFSAHEIHTKKYKNELSGAFFYALFWGVCEDPRVMLENIKEKMKSIIKEDMSNLTLRWMPLKWSDGPLITEWFWLCLLEISPMETPPDEKLDKNWITTTTESNEI